MNYRINFFVALALPVNIQKELLEAGSCFPGRKFSTNLHLTLYFIGNATCPDAYINELDKIRGETFTLKLAKMGTFGDKILWAGLDPSEPLSELQESIAQKMSALGHKSEKRSYNPHITLCRLKSPLNAAERQIVNKVKYTGSWQANSFCFYESALLPNGAAQKIIKSFPLMTGK